MTVRITNLFAIPDLDLALNDWVEVAHADV